MEKFVSKFINRILEFSPYLEVVIRKLYWQIHTFHSVLAQLSIVLKKIRRHKREVIFEKVDFDKILNALDDFGVSPNGILVIHSSMHELVRTELTAREIIEKLIEYNGLDGTIAMPAFPKYKDEPAGVARITADLSKTIFKYDVNRTTPWTGAIPFHLMRRKDSIRSSHPLNSMVAVGKDAVAMMEKNIKGERPLPCGKNSSWNYCLQQDAKIIFLGVDVAHSLTMIHVAEDCYVEDWPIKNWYRDRIFRVVDSIGDKNILVGERDPKWSMHYAERTLARDLLRFGIQKHVNISGIDISVIDSKELLDFLNNRKSFGYPYYMWK